LVPQIGGSVERGGQNELGAMYRNGDGVPQNYNEAVNWFRKAAEQGDENAKKALDILNNK